MITNFEDITADLTDEEKRLLPLLLKGFSTKTKANPVKAPVIVERINAARLVSFKFSEVRLRKLCNYIRKNGLLPLIATSKGYYVSYDPEEISREVESLLERAQSIAVSAQGLRKFLEQTDENKQVNSFGQLKKNA